MTKLDKLPPCPIETTMLLIGSKWAILILRDLFEGDQRFGQLKKSLNGISQKVLTSQLRKMEEQGIVTRTVYPEVPPRVEYSLTELGRTLGPVIDSMYAWGEWYQEQHQTEQADK